MPFIRFIPIVLLLSFASLAQNKPVAKISPIAGRTLHNLLIGLPVCALSSKMDVAALAAYCAYFGATYSQSPELVGHTWCANNSDDKPICQFTSNDSTELWGTNSDQNSEFIEVYRNKKLFHDWVAERYKNGQSLVKHRTPSDLGKNLLIALVGMHPFTRWLDQSVVGQRIKQHADMQWKNAIGLGVDQETYYEFINSVSPFKEVSAMPSFMRSEQFWKLLDQAYQTYWPIGVKGFNPKLLDLSLLPLREYLKAALREKPFLLYGIDGNIPGSGIDTKVRIILYYEDVFFGKPWGKTLILHLSPINSVRKKFIVAANYDLTGSPAQSFLIEQYVSPNFPDSPRKNRTDSQESCMTCHLEINKPKVGNFSMHPPENTPSYADFKDAFILSNPYLDRAQGSDKLKVFKHTGATHLFPEELIGVDGKRLRIYRRDSLGPFLGDPKNAPRSYACFARISPSLASEANCHGCHDNSPGNLGAISILNFNQDAALLRLGEASKYESTNYVSSTHKLLAQELFMPYGLYPEGANEAMSGEDINKLMACLKSEFPKDYNAWLMDQILAFLSEK